MPAPILSTKLYIPPARLALVPRPRLIERLNEGLTRKLTLISAPAGFGKTSLVSDWLRQLDLPIVWLSLGEIEIAYTIYLLCKPLVVTLFDEESMSEREPVQVMEPA